MYLAYPKEMREIDKRAIEEYKIPGIILMENAASALYRHIHSLNIKKVVVVCGTGNNGGDGFALARLLYINGYEASVFCFGDISKISGDAGTNLEILKSMGLAIKNCLEDMENNIRECDAVVDAIFGTGFRGQVEGIHKEVIECINRYSKYTIAVDMPSGITGDSGEKGGECIYARDTITFGCLKIGHVLHEGRIASGNIIVENISLPGDCMDKQNIMQTTNYGEYPLSLIKKREIDTHKGDYGKIYIIGGSNLMSGAVILCARAALHGGAGLVTCVVPGDILNRVGSSVPEATYVLSQERDGQNFVTSGDLNTIMERASAIAIGVGLGLSAHMANSLAYLIQNSLKPIVIDADGLNMLSGMKEILTTKKCQVVLTPHPGEMSRLAGYSTGYINKNRINVARDFAQRYNCTVLLKGASTVVTDGKRVYVNTSGNPGMASGGSGDALTGLITSLIGQGYEPYEAAVLGAYIHGRAGEDAYEKTGFGLTASELIMYIGKYIKK